VSGQSWICVKCNVPLEPKKTLFSYLGNTFSHDVKACPVCGAVMIPQDLAEGRMADIEKQLEDK
jgi:rubrerythrin